MRLTLRVFGFELVDFTIGPSETSTDDLADSVSTAASFGFTPDVRYCDGVAGGEYE